MKTPNASEAKKTVKKQVKATVESVKSGIKEISGIVVACGVGSIMGNVMRDYKPDAKGIQKLMIKIGAAAITGMVIKAATDYVNDGIDDIFDVGEEIAVTISVKKEDKVNEHDSEN